jgi:small subunit ribosomal protein S16
MVRIRLRRVGLKGQPSYRIVVADKEAPRDGRFLEILGNYNPRTQPAWIQVDEPRAYHWLKNGAVPSESVTQIFQSAGLLGRYERFKQGEDLETLIAEAKSAEATRNINPKTETTQPARKKKSDK